MFSQSATSCGLMQNVDYSGCNGGSGQVTFPQLTVYDSMVLHNKSIKFYINWTETTTWVDGNSPPGETRTAPCSYATNGPGMLGGSEFPDVCMDGIAQEGLCELFQLLSRCGGGHLAELRDGIAKRLQKRPPLCGHRSR